MGADPAFFASQIVFFVWAAVLLAFFVKCLVEEVNLKGWHSSRTLWSCCLCVSSTIFVIDQLDPRAILGIYPPQLLKFIEWTEVIALTQSIAFAGYVYMGAMYQRNMGSVPAFLRNYWLGFNAAFSFTHLVLGVIGAVTNTVLWFGVSELLLVVQEVVIATVLNVSISKLSGYLRQLTQEMNTLGGTPTNYGAALRKMLIVGVYTSVITIAACAFEIAAPGHAADNLSHPFTPIFYNNSKFSALTLVYPALVCCLHSLCLYMIRRPQPKSEKPTKESGSAVTRPSTASVVNPIVVVDVPGTSNTTPPQAVKSVVVDTNDSQPCDIVVVA